MPQVTVYIRVEDLKSWKALKKKSEFIHNALLMFKPVKTYAEKDSVPLENLESTVEDRVTVIDEPKQVEDFARGLGGLCEHGAGKGFCKIGTCRNYQFR